MAEVDSSLRMHFETAEPGDKAFVRVMSEDAEVFAKQPSELELMHYLVLGAEREFVADQVSPERLKEIRDQALRDHIASLDAAGDMSHTDDGTPPWLRSLYRGGAKLILPSEFAPLGILSAGRVLKRSDDKKYEISDLHRILDPVHEDDSVETAIEADLEVHQIDEAERETANTVVAGIIRAMTLRS